MATLPRSFQRATVVERIEQSLSTILQDLSAGTNLEEQDAHAWVSSAGELSDRLSDTELQEHDGINNGWVCTRLPGDLDLDAEPLHMHAEGARYDGALPQLSTE
jgi:hypothetical protein